MSATLNAAQIQKLIAEKKKKIKHRVEEKTQLLETKKRIVATNAVTAARTEDVLRREQFVKTTADDKTVSGVSMHPAAVRRCRDELATFAKIEETLDELKPLYSEEQFLRAQLEEVQKKIQEREAKVGFPPAKMCTWPWRGGGSLLSTQKEQLSSTPGVNAELGWGDGSDPNPRLRLSEVPESTRRKLHREEMIQHRCNPDLHSNLYDNCKQDFHFIARKRGWIEDEGITFDSILAREAGGCYEKAVEIMEGKRRGSRYRR